VKVTQLRVNIEERLYQKLKIALEELGYGSISEWVREMARVTVREAESNVARKQTKENAKREYSGKGRRESKNDQSRIDCECNI